MVPHFSVRSKQYRYTLCSSGEEELYDFDADPREWNNLADDPAYTAIKAKLKKQLIALRDGANWESLVDLHRWTYGAQKGGIGSSEGTLTFSGHSSSYLATIAKYKNFEWEFEAKSPDARQIRVSYHARVKDHRVVGTVANVPPTSSNLEGVAVSFEPGQWNRYRIRVVNERCQVWINGRLHSDVVDASNVGAGVVGLDFPAMAEPTLSLRDVRIRTL
ncbi:MAG: DUF1080 domain-containing protein [Phycisphaera sp. RhM]|nr:DUF1080 domain-containing protein [Phycisphaera sp. RhM]